MIRRILLLLFLLRVLAVPCPAAELDGIIESQGEALELDELEDAASPYLGDMELGDMELDEGLQWILETGSGEVSGVLRKAVRSSMLLLSVVLLTGLAGGLLESGKLSGLPVVAMAGTLGITAIAVADVSTLIGLGERTLDQMAGFANVLFPVVTALTAATGAISGAAVRQMAAMLFSDILINLMNGLLLPLVYAYLAASVAHAALGNDGLKRVAALLKWSVTLILTILLMAFVAYLSLSGVIAGHTDAATLKAAKFTMSSAIPVVGGILSDAAETVLAGLGILRGTVGVYGMLAVLAMCLTPFLQLGAHYLSYKLAAALAATVADPRLSGLIDSIGAAFGLILGMTGAGTLTLIISLVSALSVMNV